MKGFVSRKHLQLAGFWHSISMELSGTPLSRLKLFWIAIDIFSVGFNWISKGKLPGHGNGIGH